MNFRDGANGGTRVFRGGFLLDGNRRGQALDAVHIRLAHQFQELARVGGQALDIPPLPFSINRVERQRRFARAGQPGDDGELFARNRNVDVLQVMFTRAADRDEARVFLLNHSRTNVRVLFL